MMLCQICKKNPATVHVQEIVNGEKRTMHFCAECAEKKSMLEPFLKGMTLAGLIRKLEQSDLSENAKVPASGQEEKEEKAPDPVCPECAWTLERLKKTGHLGCPACCSVFYSVLKPELTGMHRGLTPCGLTPPGGGSSVRTPKKMMSASRMQLELDTLKKNLNECIRREEYELAAELRDRIASLGKKLAGEGMFHE